MKKVYQKPEVIIVEFTAMESIADAIDDGASTAGGYDPDYDPWA